MHASQDQRLDSATQRYEQLFAFFMALFVTFVLLTNTVGVKLFTLAGVTLPVSILWYPLTFLVTDIVSEVYGSRRARYLVIMGFCMSVLLLGFSLIGVVMPAASVYALGEDYRNIYCPDEAVGGRPRKPGVGIQCDDVANAIGHGGHLAPDGNERGICGAPKKPIQFVQLPTFPFPADPLAFLLVPQAPAMQ